MPLATRLSQTTTPPHDERYRPKEACRSAERKPWLLDEDQIIGTTETAAALNVSVSHLRRLYRAGTIPPPIRISGRKYGWRVGTIRSVIRNAEQRVA